MIGAPPPLPSSQNFEMTTFWQALAHFEQRLKWSFIIHHIFFCTFCRELFFLARYDCSQYLENWVVDNQKPCLRPDDIGSYASGCRRLSAGHTTFTHTWETLSSIELIESH